MVDDQSFNLIILEELIKSKFDVSISVAMNGQEAIDQVMRNEQENK